jgi:transposase
MLDQGYSYEKIARVLLTDNSTIQRWYSVYQSDGLEILFKSFYIGSEGKFTLEQKQALSKHLGEKVCMTAKEICQVVQTKFGIAFSSKGMTHLLHRLDFSYRKPKHIPVKANPDAQEEFLEGYNELKDTKGSKDRI